MIKSEETTLHKKRQQISVFQEITKLLREEKHKWQSARGWAYRKSQSLLRFKI